MSGYLLDSNAYFRLAKSFHPLLGGPFSPQQIVLNVLAEVDREHSHSPRLDSKFAWVTQEEYVRNRRANLLTVRGVEADNVKHAAWFIRDWVRASRQLFRERNATPPSPADCAVLAHAHAIGITVVTDDKGMEIAAKEFAIQLIGGDQLLRLLLDAQVVTLEQIRTAAGYLAYERDLPAAWRRNAKKLFGIALP